MDYNLTCAHGPISIAFEFIAVDEAIASVQTNISLSYLTTSEKLEWGIYEAWISYRSLALFEAALGTQETATLMSGRGQTLVRIVEDSGGALLEVSSRLSPEALEAESTLLCVTAEPGLKRSLERSFFEYAKWW